MVQPSKLCRHYLAFAGLGLGAAGGAMAWDPTALAGFFYHPKLLAVVHFLTLGWITSSLLAFFHLVPDRGTQASSTYDGKGRADLLAFWILALGASGVMSHFWIGETSGVGWSGLLVGMVILREGIRGILRWQGTSIPPGLTLGATLAVFHLLLAAVLAMGIVLDRYFDILPGFVLTHVFTHAHLAALGWALLLLASFADTVLPGTPSSHSGKWIGLFEALLLLLAVGLWTGVGLPWTALPVALLVLGITAGWWWSPRLAALPRNRRRLFLEALVYLSLAAVLGLLVLFLPEGPWSLRLTLAYGVLGLLGGLATLTLALLRHLLPEPSSAWPFDAWSVVVPATALGFTFDLLPLIRLGGLAILLTAAFGARRWIQS